jgi:hypothetical protein
MNLRRQLGAPALAGSASEFAVSPENSRSLPIRCLQRPKGGTQKIGPEVGFTLIEVLIAVAIFFMAMFAILGVLSQSLRAAASLRKNGPTVGMIAAEMSLTNRLETGADSGDFGEFYPGYQWTRETLPYGSNGLFQIDIVVVRDGNIDSSLSFLLYRPESGSKFGIRK